jgi:hypothetical protein
VHLRADSLGCLDVDNIQGVTMYASSFVAFQMGYGVENLFGFGGKTKLVPCTATLC